MKNLINITIFAVFTLSLYSQWESPIRIEELSSEGEDFAPSWSQYENLLYFNVLSNKKSEFYTASYENGKFTNIAKVKGDLNKRSNNPAFISFLNDEEAYLGDYHSNKYGTYVNIHKTIRQRVWTESSIIDSLLCDCFSSHPTVSPSGEFLVFSSNRQSTKGSLNLWMSLRAENGSWGSPFEIFELNSPGNEITPYFAGNDTLFFASDGQEGPGEFDIYFSIRTRGSWGRPKIVRELNTEFNESDITLLPDGSIVFASDRPGGSGKLDLYLAKRKVQKLNESQKEPIELAIKSNIDRVLIIEENSTLEIPIPVSYRTNIRNDADPKYLIDSELTQSIAKGKLQTEIEIRKIITEPEKLLFNLDSRPIRSDLNWSLVSLDFEGNEIIIQEQTGLPYEFNFDLMSFVNENQNTTALRFSLIALSENTEYRENIKLNPVKSIIKKQYSINNGTEIFDVMFLPNEDISGNNKIINEIIFAESTTKKIIIESFDAASAKKLQDILKSRMNLEYEIKNSYSSDLISPAISKLYTRILLQKYN